MTKKKKLPIGEVQDVSPMRCDILLLFILLRTSKAEWGGWHPSGRNVIRETACLIFKKYSWGLLVGWNLSGGD